MKLYDLAGSEDNRHTSPYCWRIRLALAHNAVPFHTEPWRGVEKDKIAFTGQRQARTVSLIAHFNVRNSSQPTFKKTWCV
jgi:hypothetical protein